MAETATPKLPKDLPKNYSGKVFNGGKNDRGKKTFDVFVDGKYVKES